jgi:hypothetical protein
MKKIGILLCACLAAALAACSTNSSASSDTKITIAWTNNGFSATHSQKSYLIIAKGGFGVSQDPAAGAVIFTQAVNSSTSSVSTDLAEDGDYTAGIFYDYDDNRAFSSSADLIVTAKAFTFTAAQGASVALSAYY